MSKRYRWLNPGEEPTWSDLGNWIWRPQVRRAAVSAAAGYFAAQTPYYDFGSRAAYYGASGVYSGLDSGYSRSFDHYSSYPRNGGQDIADLSRASAGVARFRKRYRRYRRNINY